MAILLIFLASYSITITAICLMLLIYATCLIRKKRYKCAECSNKLLPSECDPEQPVTLATDVNALPKGDLSFTTSNIQRSQSHPHGLQRTTIYDPLTSSAVKISKPTTDREKVVVEEGYHHYESILETAANTPTDLHDDLKEKIETEVYDTFLKELLENVLRRTPDLHETLFRQRQYSILSKHQYECIDQRNDDDDFDSIYVRYLGDNKKIDGGTDVKKHKNCIMSFGSNQHLKYLRESIMSQTTSKTDETYLTARCFKPEDNCPPDLRLICQKQKSNMDNKKTTKTVESCTKGLPLETQPYMQHVNSDVFSQIDAKHFPLEPTHQKPLLPPKMKQNVHSGISK